MSNESTMNAKDTLMKVLELTKEAGYMEVNQIIGYLVTEDPTYVPSKNGARELLEKYERDEYLEMLVQEFWMINGK